ncbi:MAG: lysophospholipase L1-like esterase [Planctomycetota bacterium]|jgi:lysophospholipase L1-like esterase
MSNLTRRSFVALGSAFAASSLLPGSDRALWTPPKKLAWTDVVDWPIEGRAFDKRLEPYGRLPARAKGVVRDRVWELSRNSAGMLVRFATNSAELHVRYQLSSATLGMVHMPPTGVSGADLYGRDGKQWRWIDVTRPSKQKVGRRFFANQPTDKNREFQIYLPLYNGVDKFEIGTTEDAELKPLPARGSKQRPLVCYGTSIMHGACSSRPGMAWTSIMGRALDREVMNFGFSGSGRMELEVGQYLAELDASVYVVDCLPNMTPDQVAKRTQPLVRQLRAARKNTPILLIEDRSFTNAWFDKGRHAEHVQRRKALRNAFDALRKDGVKGLHYLEGDKLLGTDSEAATDGSHPSDLGMMRQAEAVTAALRPLLR